MENGRPIGINEFFIADEIIPEYSQEIVPDEREEFLPYVSPVFQFQTTTSRLYSVAQFFCEGCTCCPGETCRRLRPPTLRVVFKQQIQCPFTYILRLRCFESWELSVNESSQKMLGVLSKRRCSAFDLWQYPELFRGFQACEVRPGCSSDRIWFNPRGNRLGIPWLLLAQQTQDRGFLFFYFSEKFAEVTGSHRITHPVYEYAEGNHLYSRMVEYQFVLRSEIQDPSAVHSRSSEFAQNYVNHDDLEIFSSLSDDHSRGFLRLL